MCIGLPGGLLPHPPAPPTPLPYPCCCSSVGAASAPAACLSVRSAPGVWPGDVAPSLPESDKTPNKTFKSSESGWPPPGVPGVCTPCPGIGNPPNPLPITLTPGGKTPPSPADGSSSSSSSEPPIRSGMPCNGAATDGSSRSSTWRQRRISKYS